MTPKHPKKYTYQADRSSVVNVKTKPIKVSKHIKKKMKLKEYVPPEVKLDLTGGSPSLVVEPKPKEKTPQKSIEKKFKEERNTLKKNIFTKSAHSTLLRSKQIE